MNTMPKRQKAKLCIKVTVTPGAKKECLKEISPGIFILFVKEKAERNMANKRTRELLAKYFGVTAGKAQMIKGHRSFKKLFEINA